MLVGVLTAIQGCFIYSPGWKWVDGIPRGKVTDRQAGDNTGGVIAHKNLLD